MKVTSVLSTSAADGVHRRGGVCGGARLREPGDWAGRLSPGEFTAFIAALFMMYAPAKKLNR